MSIYAPGQSGVGSTLRFRRSCLPTHRQTGRVGLRLHGRGVSALTLPSLPGKGGEARNEAPPPPSLPLGSYGRGVQVYGAAEDDMTPPPYERRGGEGGGGASCLASPLEGRRVRARTQRPLTYAGRA